MYSRCTCTTSSTLCGDTDQLEEAADGVAQQRVILLRRQTHAAHDVNELHQQLQRRVDVHVAGVVVAIASAGGVHQATVAVVKYCIAEKQHTNRLEDLHLKVTKTRPIRGHAHVTCVL